MPTLADATAERHDVGDSGDQPTCEAVRAAEQEELELPLRSDAELQAVMERAAHEAASEAASAESDDGDETSDQSGEQPAPDRALAYGDRVSAEFAAAVVDMCRRLEMDPDHLMAIMHYETGGSFRPSIRNRFTRAVGLIQFLPSTARILGTTDDDLEGMSDLEQLVWVERYFSRFQGHLGTLGDAYMAVLYPVAVTEPPDFVLFRRGSISYENNPGLDADDDGEVTKGEVVEAVQRVLDNGRAALAADE